MMISLLLLCHNIFSAKLVPPNGCGKGQALRVLGKQFSCVHFSKEKILFAKTLTAPLSPSVLPKKIIMAHKKISIYTYTCSICNRELTHSEIAAQQDQHIDFNSYVCDDCRYTQVNEHLLPDTFTYSDAGQILFTVKKHAA